MPLLLMGLSGSMTVGRRPDLGVCLH